MRLFIEVFFFFPLKIEQSEKFFRPPMSEIVSSLTSLRQKFTAAKSGAMEGAEVDHFERSFRSTNTRFITSPTPSYISVWLLQSVSWFRKWFTVRSIVRAWYLQFQLTAFSTRSLAIKQLLHGFPLHVLSVLA